MNDFLNPNSLKTPHLRFAKIDLTKKLTSILYLGSKKEGEKITFL